MTAALTITTLALIALLARLAAVLMATDSRPRRPIHRADWGEW